MSNIIYVNGYRRQKYPERTAARYVEMTERLLPYDLGAELIGALERELSEPLDWIEIPEEQARRIRESF